MVLPWRDVDGREGSVYGRLGEAGARSKEQLPQHDTQTSPTIEVRAAQVRLPEALRLQAAGASLWAVDVGDGVWVLVWLGSSVHGRVLHEPGVCTSSKPAVQCTDTATASSGWIWVCWRAGPCWISCGTANSNNSGSSALPTLPDLPERAGIPALPKLSDLSEP